jgi:hypothetical protein
LSNQAWQLSRVGTWLYTHLLCVLASKLAIATEVAAPARRPDGNEAGAEQLPAGVVLLHLLLHLLLYLLLLLLSGHGRI